MRIVTLYINTKDLKLVVVKLKENGKIVDSLKGENEYGSEILLPLICQLLKRNSKKFKDLTSIEIEEGPGSFTGLRVGASIAQALSFVFSIPLNGRINKLLNLKYT